MYHWLYRCNSLVKHSLRNFLIFLTQLPRPTHWTEAAVTWRRVETKLFTLLKLPSVGRVYSCHVISHSKKNWGKDQCVSLVIGPSIWFILGQLGPGWSIWWSFEDLMSTFPITEDVWESFGNHPIEVGVGSWKKMSLKTFYPIELKESKAGKLKLTTML